MLQPDSDQPGLFSLDPAYIKTGKDVTVNFLIYPAIDGDYNFPHEVRQAIADSPEISAKIDSNIDQEIQELSLDGGSP